MRRLPRCCFGDTNPGGRLPITFPASLDQLPRPRVDGADWVEPEFSGDPVPGQDKLYADYDIEGSDVGYRWFARKGTKPLFPFGFGLSYTTFVGSGLKVANSRNGMTASFTLANTGKRKGDDLGQVYLVSRAGEGKRRLVGFKRVTLEPGASQDRFSHARSAPTGRLERWRLDAACGRLWLRAGQGCRNPRSGGQGEAGGAQLEGLSGQTLWSLLVEGHTHRSYSTGSSEESERPQVNVYLDGELAVIAGQQAPRAHAPLRVCQAGVPRDGWIGCTPRNAEN